VAVNRKFTRIPKTTELVRAGVPIEAIPTYCCLADHASNKTGLCWPKMETLAQILNRSVRTIQRHLHLLRSLGLIEFVERRRHRGRFSSYLYRVLHIVATTGHRRQVESRSPNKGGTKPVPTPPKSPKNYEDYAFFFGEEYEAHNAREEDRQDKYKNEYEWFFG
jgi:DNA-binding transcriptional MocR family regulator